MLNLRIKHRILLGCLVPVAIFVLASLIVYSNVRKGEDKALQFQSSSKVVSIVKDLEISSVRMQRSARGYILIRNETSRKAFESSEEGFRKAAEELEKLSVEPAKREKLQKLVELYTRLVEYDRHLLSLVDDGRQEEAIKEFATLKGLNMGTELEKLVYDFDKVETGAMEQVALDEDKALHLINTILFAVTVLSAVIASGIGLWLSSRISSSIMEGANAIASSSTEIAATIEEHEKTAASQAAMVSEMTATMEELGASSRQSTEQATSAANVAQKATALTDEGKEAVKQAIDAMNGLKGKVEAVADQILKLGEQTAQIGDLADIVRDIASQTNMLALNAAVEAVRAGEHGKGFSVLASEVRKLADQSKKSAEEARSLITDIQKATNSTIMVTEEGTKKVDDVTALARKVGDLFANLAGSAGSVYENAQQVLLNTRQQSAAFGQVVTAINNINSGTKETAAGISQTRIGVQRLNEAALVLKASV